MVLEATATGDAVGCKRRLHVLKAVAVDACADESQAPNDEDRQQEHEEDYSHGATIFAVFALFGPPSCSGLAIIKATAIKATEIHRLAINARQGVDNQLN